jgi:hypothetical protein
MDRFEFDTPGVPYWFTKEGACECFFSDGSVHENLPSRSVTSIGIRALLRELTTARTALAEAMRERDKYKPLAIDFGQQLNESGKRITALEAENTRLRAELAEVKQSHT